MKGVREAKQNKLYESSAHDLQNTLTTLLMQFVWQ